MYAKIALGNVTKSIRDFSVFFLTLALGVCVFYAFGTITEQTAVLELSQNQRDIVQDLMSMLNGVQVLMAVILGFLVVYANRFLIRRRKREFGIYLVLGMPARDVSLIVVVETLVVGAVALAAGLVLGVALSQVMMYATAALFETTIAGFSFILSGAAALRTAGYFACIFAVTLVLNVRAVNKYKLIDLMNAERVSEEVKVRSLPVSVVLFVIAAGTLAYAYWTLVTYGMLGTDNRFVLATVLCIAGTFLLFFSVSGFLLRALQQAKGLYLRGLNMFVLRQLNSRINTAWLSISLVCFMIFVAVCGVCTGFSVAQGYNEAVSAGNAYDASLLCYPTGIGFPERNTAAAADNYSMVAALRRDVPEFDELVSAYVQVDLRNNMPEEEPAASWAWFVQNTSYTSANSAVNETLDAYRDGTIDAVGSPINVVALSQVNALRELAGEEPLELADDECLMWNDYELLNDFWRAACEQNPTIEVWGHTLTFASAEPVTTRLCSSSSGTTVQGVLIVADSVIPEDARYVQSYLNVMYNGTREEVDAAFCEALDTAYVDFNVQDNGEFPWPVWSYGTAAVYMGEASGTRVSVTYLAVYIGFVLLVSCASVLALQQLSEAADNAGRYRVLAELGTEPRDLRRSLATQIGIYFGFPLAVAVAHAAVALYVVNDYVGLLTGYQVSGALVGSVVFVVALYGGYFLVTYLTSKSMLLRNGVRS